MGSRIDGIESEIREKRSRAEDHVTTLRTRAENDVISLQAEAQARADKVIGDAKDAIHSAGEKLELEDRIRSHPYPMLAAGVGAGAFLGYVTGRGDGGREEDHHADDSPGLLSHLLAPITGTAVDMLRSEVRGVVRDRIGEFVESIKSRKAEGTAGADQQGTAEPDQQL
jgi:ElaB/YqjD/DUF883 family membrane-anchored ribosome-binding protein